MKIDMHNHSKYSIDSISSPSDIIRIAKQRGLDGLAITDHDTFRGYKNIKKLPKDFIVIPGMEIKVYNENKKVGEILAFFIQEEIKSKQVFEVIDEIKSQDAFASIAHPFRINGSFSIIDDVKNKIDAIEVMNGRVVFSKSNATALKYAKKNKLGFTAGSDSHFLREIGHCGIEAAANNIEEFRHAIKKGKCHTFGKESPFWVHAISQFTRCRRMVFGHNI
jgi:predicted metal-dependent phosphoesterase TrpH